MTTKQEMTGRHTASTKTGASPSKAADQPVPSTSDAPVAESSIEPRTTGESAPATADLQTRARETAETAKVWIGEKVTTGTQVVRQRAQELAEKNPQAKERAAQVGRTLRERPGPAVLSAGATVILLVVRRRRRAR